MSRRKIAALALAAAVIAPLTVADAATAPKIDVWSGKSKSKKIGVQIIHVRGDKEANVQLSVPCEDGGGNATTGDLGDASPYPSSGKVTFSSAAGNGTLKLKATAKKGKAATGSFSYELPEAYGSCKGTDTFKLKWKLARGG